MSSSRDVSTQEKMARYYDVNFPKMTIRAFVAEKLNVAEDQVADVLFAALKAEKQNEEGKQYILKALDYTVNASGAVMLMVNTNEGLQMVGANSLRRAKVVASNGACEANESMAMTAAREFVEELGNPAPNGILRGIVSNMNNCVSVEETNQIGSTAAAIADRIVEKKASKASLYVNFSAMYVNAAPVNARILAGELSTLSARLSVASASYSPAVDMMYGKPPANFDDAETRLKAVTLINQFKAQSPEVISDNFSAVFAKAYDENSDKASVKEALSAIIDLTENNQMFAIPRAELEFLLSLDLKSKQVEDQLKKEYFVPALLNIVAHMKELTSNQYLTQLANRVSMAQLMAATSMLTNEPQQGAQSTVDAANSGSTFGKRN